MDMCICEFCKYVSVSGSPVRLGQLFVLAGSYYNKVSENILIEFKLICAVAWSQVKNTKHIILGEYFICIDILRV